MDEPSSRGSIGRQRIATAPSAAAPKHAEPSPKASKRAATVAPTRQGARSRTPQEDLPQERRRGRPSIGEPHKVRLGALEDFAVRYGEGNLAEGVRRAVEFARRHTPGERDVDAAAGQQDVEALVLPTSLLAEVREVGGGSVVKGLTTLVKAARVLTHDGVRKLGKG